MLDRTRSEKNLFKKESLINQLPTEKEFIYYSGNNETSKLKLSNLRPDPENPTRFLVDCAITSAIEEPGNCKEQVMIMVAKF